MNELAGAGVLAENRLFATLDATTRTVEISPGRDVLLSDTVGFIRKLPHRLIESFKSTLDEVRESDILMHVLDASHPSFHEHKDVVQRTLLELDVRDKPTLLVFNKVDAIEDPLDLLALKNEFPDAAFVSALRGIGLKELRDKLIATIDAGFEEIEAVIPVTDQKAIQHIRTVAEVLKEDYTWGRVPYEAETLGVVRLLYRVAPRYAEDLSALTERYKDLKVVSEDSLPV